MHVRKINTIFISPARKNYSMDILKGDSDTGNSLFCDVYDFQTLFFPSLNKN